VITANIKVASSVDWENATAFRRYTGIIRRILSMLPADRCGSRQTISIGAVMTWSLPPESTVLLPNAPCAGYKAPNPPIAVTSEKSKKDGGGKTGT
jgi:hypothetical protein